MSLIHIEKAGITIRIITISRQFGSGGRELGKRLADVLGWDYYDKQIISQLANESGYQENYIKSMLDSNEANTYSLTFQNSFNSFFPEYDIKSSLLKRQREIIEGIAQANRDCIIVGRDADIILQDYKPFRVFVCADMDERIARCMKYEEKKDTDRLSEKEIEKNIKKIDKQRGQIRELLTGKEWGDSTSFDLTLNVGGKNIKALAKLLSEFSLEWFENA